MLGYAAILIWASLLALQVYRYDRYSRAPLSLLLLICGLGFAAMAAIGRLEDVTNQVLDLSDQNVMGQALVASTHEELARLLLVGLMALVFRRRFTDPMDGLTYGGFAAIGMALEESLFYAGMSDSLGFALVCTESVRLLLHLLMGSVTAFAFGMAVNRMKRWPLALAGGLAAAIFLHFSWDSLVGIPQSALGEPAVGPRIIAVVLMLSLMALFAAFVSLATRWSREKFAPNAEPQLWGWPFVWRRTRAL